MNKILFTLFIFATLVYSNEIEIELNISGDFPKEERIYPNVVSLNGKNVRKHTFNSGKYLLEISHPGYEPLVEEITIPPQNEPFLLTRELVTKKRQLQIRITYDVAPPEDIFSCYVKMAPLNKPYEMQAVSENDLIKPGAYLLLIERQYYETIEIKQNVWPDERSFSIDQVMRAKLVKIHHYISHDVPPPPQLPPYMASLIRVESKVLVVYSWRGIVPGEYELKISQPGYTGIAKRIYIAPSDTPFIIKETLYANPRKINFSITDSTTQEPIMPLEICHINPNQNASLNVLFKRDSSETTTQKAYPAGTQLLFRIIAEGYKLKEVSVHVFPGEDALPVNITMAKKIMEIELDITGDYPPEERIDPEIVNLSGKDAREYSFQLGKYTLEIQHPGYEILNKEIIILPQEKPFLIQEVLVAKKRKININITYDVTPPQNSRPYKITFAPIARPDEIAEVKIGDYIKPGSYICKIEKDFYETIEIRQNVWPDERPFFLNEMMRTKQVRVYLQVDRDIPCPQDSYHQVYWNNSTFLVQYYKRVRPGNHEITIIQPGYETVKKQIYIPPMDEVFQLKARLLALPRQIFFKTKDSIIENFVEPLQIIDITSGSDAWGETVLFESKDYGVVTQKKYPAGKKASFRIMANKYSTKEVDVIVVPGEGDLVLDVSINKKLTIELNITGDYPAGERVVPKIITLNGKDVRENFFAPGKYALAICHQGYENFTKEITLTPQQEPFIIKEVIIAKKRKLEVNLTYKPKPLDNTNSYKITLIALDKPEDTIEVKEGDMVKPNSYLLRIEKKFYETFEQKQNIWPDERPFCIYGTLLAKMVPVEWNMTYDFPKPEELSSEITIKYNGHDVELEEFHRLFTEKLAMPGNYKFSAQLPGYHPLEKQVVIPPMDGVFTIDFDFHIQKKPIYFQTTDSKTGILVKPLEIIDLSTNKKYDAQNTYLPDSQRSFRLKFEEYATQDISIKTKFSNNPLYVPVLLIKLHSLQIMSPLKEVVLDDVSYSYQFIANGKEVEPHHITIIKKQKFYTHTVMLLPDTTKLQIIQGYISRDITLDATQNIITVHTQVDSIAVDRLVVHLQKIIDQDHLGYPAALKVLKSLLLSPMYRKMLEKCSYQDIHVLRDFMQTWKCTEEQRNKIEQELKLLEQQ